MAHDGLVLSHRGVGSPLGSTPLAATGKRATWWVGGQGWAGVKRRARRWVLPSARRLRRTPDTSAGRRRKRGAGFRSCLCGLHGGLSRRGAFRLTKGCSLPGTGSGESAQAGAHARGVGGERGLLRYEPPSPTYPTPPQHTGSCRPPSSSSLTPPQHGDMVRSPHGRSRSVRIDALAIVRSGG